MLQVLVQHRADDDNSVRPACFEVMSVNLFDRSTNGMNRQSCNTLFNNLGIYR